MHRSWIKAVAVTGVLLVLGPAKSRASSWVTQTACDSVQISGITYPRVTFSVQNLDPTFSASLVSLLPVAASPGDTCRVLAIGAPETWTGILNQSNSTAAWSRTADDGSLYIVPGGSLDGFQLVLSRGHSCCFDFSVVGPYPEPLGQENVCFECQMPVPVLKSTWGAVKVLYR